MSNLDLPKLPPLWGVSTGPDRGRVKLMRSAPMGGPGLRLCVNFPAGGDAKRSEFLRKLKHFIDENL